MIRLARPRLPGAVMDEVGRLLASGDLVQGPTVAAFEGELARIVAVPHAVAVSSGTAALHASLLALGIGPGDEVVVPAFSFPAPANVVVLSGATPVPVDIGLTDYCLDPAAVRAAVTTDTRAVIAVHEFGLAADWSALASIGRHEDLHLVEDAACALGATHEGRPCGSLGTVGCFSFHPRKTVTTGEGGFVSTSDTALARAVRQLRSHGMESGPAGREFVRAGLNYRMTEFQAAIGMAQLPSLARLVDRRREQADRYAAALSGLPLTVPGDRPGRPHTWQSYHVLLDGRADRDAVIAGMRAAGVEVTIGAQALPALQYYRDVHGWREEAFPAAATAYRRGLALPIGEHLTDADQETVITALHRVLRAGTGARI